MGAGEHFPEMSFGFADAQDDALGLKKSKSQAKFCHIPQVNKPDNLDLSLKIASGSSDDYSLKGAAVGFLRHAEGCRA
jgi:hypothetical protein